MAPHAERTWLRRRSLLVVVLFLCVCTDAFNLDLTTAVVHKSIGENRDSSWFGFAMDFYRTEDETWLIVGAPRDQSPQQREVRKGGRVYRCMTSDTKCRSIQAFELEGNKPQGLNGSEPIILEEKSGQWLGASIATSRTGDKLLACAPRYVYHFSHYVNKKHSPEHGPTGYCYLATANFRNPSSVTQVAPGRTNEKWGYHREGYSMWGFSSKFASDGDTFFLGGPGSFYWQGSIGVHTTGDLQDQKHTGARDKLSDDSYMGYSLAVGDFDGDGRDDVATGIPHALTDGNRKDISGMVALFNTHLESLLNISGQQIGSYFGYSLAATDLDNDGLDDLIIGEPFYVEYETEDGTAKAQYEIGRVNVYYQGADHAFRRVDRIVGHHQWSQFGLAVAAAGDLNSDGINDFVVGAPYDGKNRKGAIYVYHGGQDGIIKEHSQVIYAEEISNNVDTFGFSFASGGYDVDDNGYPDIAVGAYKSAHAIILRTRPVVKLSMRLINQDSEIDLEHKLCQLTDMSRGGRSTSTACSTVQICMTYNGPNAPASLRMKVRTNLDVEQEVKRAATIFENQPYRDEMVTLDVNMEKCVNTSFQMKEDVRDKLSPLWYEAKVTLDTPTNYNMYSLPPILDHFSNTTMREKIPLRTNCHGECVPDLQLTLTAPKGETLLLGTQEQLRLRINVNNAGDDAHQARVRIAVPPGVRTESAQIARADGEREGKQNDTRLACASQPNDVVDDNNRRGHFYECDIGNPLPTNEAVAFNVFFKADGVTTSDGPILFTVNATSFNVERPEQLHDNYREMMVDVKVDVQLEVWTKSDPVEVLFSEKDRRALADNAGDDTLPLNEQLRFDEDIGPRVVHTYQINSKAESQIDGAYVDIYWPSSMETHNGTHLLYLIDEPQVETECAGNRACRFNVKCTTGQIERVDPLGLKIDTSYRSEPVLMGEMSTSGRRVRRQAEESISTKIRQWASSFRYFINRIFRDTKKNIAYQESDSANRFFRPLVDCSKMTCTHFYCDIDGIINKGDSIVFAMYSRLWINTLIDEVNFDARITSVVNVRPKSVPGISGNAVGESIVSAATTLVSPLDTRAGSRGMPWWLYLLAILAGITLLTLLILALWRVGFFKRKRPPKSQALLTGGATAAPPAEHYGFAGGGYAPASQYDPARHGTRL